MTDGRAGPGAGGSSLWVGASTSPAVLGRKGCVWDDCNPIFPPEKKNNSLHHLCKTEMAAKLSLSKGQKGQGKNTLLEDLALWRTWFYEMHAPVGQGAQRGTEAPNLV